MNQFTQTTKATINTIKTHALLSKALSNDTKPTPGYLFPEIARLTQSPATCSIVLAQLLKVITPSGYRTSSSTHSQSIVGSSAGGAGSLGATSSAYTSSPHVLLKALKILRQLAQSGSLEFRTLLAQRGKGLLVEMVGYKGPLDEIHGDRFNEDVRTVAQDLIEYMHANPVQEHDEFDSTQSLPDNEAAVLKISTQGLGGFGNPDYESSDSEGSGMQSNARRSSQAKKPPKAERATPPLPGFGNPAFEKDIGTAEPTMMSRLVDRLQEMTAPPPPVAMRAAYRKQEQRRQKLFVGEYSMRDDGSGHGKSKGEPISVVGTNPFRRTTRTQGVAAAGWADKNDSRRDLITSRVFPLSRPGTGTIQFRNATSAAVYGLAQHLQPDLVRTKLNPSIADAQSGDSRRQDTASTGLLSIWGTAKDICDLVVEGNSKDSSVPIFGQQGDITTSSVERTVPTITGLLRDMIDWIEQEDWERRLRYFAVLDVLLACPETEADLLSDSAMPVLLKTLESPRCRDAPQRSIRELASHLSEYVKIALNRRTRPYASSPIGPSGGDADTIADMLLLNLA